jgi:predicted Fe-S protein YdhL (DUF1289 family)
MIDQGEFFQTPNPCRSICTVNNKGFCKGCFRSREERFHWHEFTEYQKHLVVQICQGREKRVEAARHKKMLREAQAKEQQQAQFDLFGEAMTYQTSESAKDTNEKDPQIDLF